MPDYARKLIYLTAAQHAELVANGTITVEGVTVTYNPNDIYVTPQEEPVTDVQINSSSIVQNGSANIPIAGQNDLGLIKVQPNDYGIGVTSTGMSYINKASTIQRKQGTGSYRPICPVDQHEAAFYGLAKAAGDSTQAASSNAVGTYTDEAKGSIQHMLGTDTLFTPYVETDLIADRAYVVGDIFAMDGKLYKVTAAIAQDGAITVGTNCEETNIAGSFPHDIQINGSSIVSNGVANVPQISTSKFGVAKVGAYGITAYGGILSTSKASLDVIKTGTDEFKTINPYNQHLSTFYGLAKAAGDSTQSASSNAVGVYTDGAKKDIQAMLGVRDLSDRINTANSLVNYGYDTDADIEEVSGTAYATKKVGVKRRGTLVVLNSVAGSYYDSKTRVKISGDVDVQVTNAGSDTWSTGIQLVEGHKYRLTMKYLSGTYSPSTNTPPTALIYAVGTHTSYTNTAVLDGMDTYRDFVAPASQVNVIVYIYESTVMTDLTYEVILEDLTYGRVSDVQINGTSILQNGVANVPLASSSTPGVGKSSNGFGVWQSSGFWQIYAAGDANIKTGNDSYRPVVPTYQHVSIFYGLSKLAGVDLANETVTVGTYPETSKSAIQTMLGVESGVSFVETGYGSTPSITGVANTRYICGEVSTISITPPNTGTIDVQFTSGTTPAVLTLPNTVKFPSWVDLTTLEASTVYEIMITDGVYGGVMTWPV